MEKNVAETLARFKQACDQGMEGFALHDAEGNFTYVNPSQAKIYGYTPEEVIGKNWSIFYNDEQASKIREIYFPTLMREKKWHGELIGLKKTGEFFDVEVALTLLLDEDDQPSGLACNCRDISGRKAAEAELRQLQKIEALGHLTAGIAHDFNNLLTILIGNLEILKHRNTSSENEKTIEKLVTVAKHGSELTNRLLTFSRQKPLNQEVIDVRNVINDVRILMDRSVGESIEIVLQNPAKPLKSNIDRSQLENALVNLLFNARDAMPTGGCVRITTLKCHRIPRSSFGYGAVDDEYVSISVHDEGNGMSPEIQEQIFNPFFSTKKEGHGTGLGMNMVHRFIMESKGRISVESEEGVGSKITLFLPSE